MKRLLVLFTGGTIGSKRQGEAINVNESGSYALIDAYRSGLLNRDDILLDSEQPLNILSENLTPADWRTLAGAVQAADRSVYSGIIVTHGSDTLAYTAAMLSFLFADIDIPLVLTASNYPLADKRSNGLRNFASSIDFIVTAACPGVFAVYENDRREPLVYLGTRINQCESFTDQFPSPYRLTFGEVADRSFVWSEAEGNPPLKSLREPQALPYRWAADSLKLSSDIVYIKPYPGLNYSHYAFGEHLPKAVLHDLHHSGTACAVEDAAYSLPRFIERCRSQGIDVYLCPIKDRSAALYSSSVALIEAGAVVIENMGIEAAMAKLMLAYGLYNDRSEAEQFVTGHNLYYERYDITEPVSDQN